MTIGSINGIIQEVVVFLEKHKKNSRLKCYQINIHQKIFETICQPFLAFYLLQRLS